MPGGLHPHAHADSSLLKVPVESLRFTIAVIQSPFSVLTRFLIHKRNLLKARVIIYAYNQHVRLLSPEPLVVNQPQSTRVEGAGIVMQSFFTSSIIRSTRIERQLLPRRTDDCARPERFVDVERA